MPSTSHPPESTPEPSAQETSALNAGLAALKKKDYPAAIAYLEPIAISHKNHPSGLRAQMGLVAGYRGNGQIHKAITLCSRLTKSSNTQVKTWATRTLEDLVKRHPPQPTRALETENAEAELQPLNQKPQPHPSEFPIETGFVAFESSPKPSSQPTSEQKLEFSETLGIPTEQLSKNPGSATGFVPLTPEPAQPPTVPPPGPTIVQKQPPAILSEDVDAEAPTQLETPQPTAESNAAPEPDTVTEPYQLTWRQTGRAQKWRPLKAIKLTSFRLEQLATAFALYWLALLIIKILLNGTNTVLLQLYVLLKLPFLKPIPLFYQNPTSFVQFIFGILFIASPWLLDKLLHYYCGLQSLPLTTLFNQSKEAHQTLRTVCQKKGWPVPALKLLSTDTPFIASYGCLPRYTRITVSRGLLDQLEADEIAAVFARELAHISHWDFVVMSLATSVLQIPYSLYWQASLWADRVPNLSHAPFIAPLKNAAPALLPILIKGLRGFLAIISAVSYSLYWLLRWPVFWLSRRRVYLSDRRAAELTGNPNALTRALVKIAIGVAQTVQQQKQTHFWLEGFDLLGPVGLDQAITLGSLAQQIPLDALLQWDLHNPERHWLTINNTHPLLGERLQLLEIYARHWKLETQLEWPAPKNEPKPKTLPYLGIPLGLAIATVTALIGWLLDLSPQQQIDWQQWQKICLLTSYFPFGYSLLQLLRSRPRLFLQGAPFFGVPIGMGLAFFVWLLGGLFYAMVLWQLEWLWGDQAILTGLLLIGFSVGTLLRINDFFPDIRPGMGQTYLPELLLDPEALPVDSQAVRLQGELLGRPGVSNGLAQDLILQTTKGLVRLHHVSVLGPLANLWPQTTQPKDLIGKSVTATGWFRRGATVAVDLESLRTPEGRGIYSSHPIWSTVLAFASAILGAFIILKGTV